MKLRYIIAIMAAALAVSYHHQDTRLAVLVIFGTCILYSLRCIDHQLGDMKGRIHALSNPSHVSSRDIEARRSGSSLPLLLRLEDRH